MAEPAPKPTDVVAAKLAWTFAELRELLEKDPRFFGTVEIKFEDGRPGHIKVTTSKRAPPDRQQG